MHLFNHEEKSCLKHNFYVKKIHHFTIIGITICTQLLLTISNVIDWDFFKILCSIQNFYLHNFMFTYIQKRKKNILRIVASVCKLKYLHAYSNYLSSGVSHLYIRLSFETVNHIKTASSNNFSIWDNHNQP